MALAHDILAYSHMLVDACTSAEDGSIPDRDVSAQHDVVDELDVVAYLAVMPHVGVDEEKTIFADHCLGFGGQAAVDRGMFADDGAGTDFAKRSFMGGVGVLGEVPDDGKRVNFAPGTDVGPSGEVGVVVDLGVFVNPDVGFDDRVGADLDGRIQFSLGINDGGGVDGHTMVLC